jgi:hypothetical protein
MSKYSGQADTNHGHAQLPLQDRDLVTQHQDLHVLIPVASSHSNANTFVTLR